MSKSKIYNIDLWVESPITIPVVQNDSDRIIRFNILENKERYDLNNKSIKCFVKTSKDTYSFDCKIIDGLVEANLTNVSLKETGTVEMQLEIKNNERVVKAFIVYIYISEDITGSALESKDELKAFEQALIELGGIGDSIRKLNEGLNQCKAENINQNNSINEIRNELNTQNNSINEIRNELNTQNSSINALKDKIDNLDIGENGDGGKGVVGKNLFRGTREYDITRTDIWNDKTHWSSQAEPVNGFGVVRITTHWGAVKQTVKLKPNTKYTMSAWVRRGGNETAPTKIGTYFTPEGFTFVKTHNFENNEVLPQEFKRIGCTFITPSSDDEFIEATPRFEPYISDYLNTTPDFFIYGYMLTEGSYMHDWEYNTEDIAELFQSVGNGKEMLASAITDKGVLTSSKDSFNTMAYNIRAIPTGSIYKEYVWEKPADWIDLKKLSTEYDDDTILLLFNNTKDSLTINYAKGTATIGWGDNTENTVTTTTSSSIKHYYKDLDTVDYHVVTISASVENPDITITDTSGLLWVYMKNSKCASLSLVNAYAIRRIDQEGTEFSPIIKANASTVESIHGDYIRLTSSSFLNCANLREVVGGLIECDVVYTDTPTVFKRCYSLEKVKGTLSGNFNSGFSECFSLKEIGDTSLVTSMKNGFEYCSLKTFNNKNLENLTDISYLFDSNRNLEEVVGCDFSNVIRGSVVFYKCHSLKKVAECSFPKNATNIDFSNLANLEELDLSNSIMEKITATNSPKLKVLKVPQTIRDIRISYNHAMTVQDFNNLFSSLPTATGTIYVAGCKNYRFSNSSIATEKGWKFYS